jgi:hypothetical protein
MVLISTVSAFFLSSLSSSFSRLNLVHEGPARSLRLHPLPCEQPQRHSESCKEANKQFLHAPGRIPTTCCVWRGEEPGRASPRMVPDNAMILSPRLAPPSPSPTRHPQTQRALVRGHKTVSWLTQQPDRTACCALRGRDRGWRASSSKCWRERVEVLLRCGAYKHRTATNPGSISISVTRCVQNCATSGAMLRSAATPGGYALRSAV